MGGRFRMLHRRALGRVMAASVQQLTGRSSILLARRMPTDLSRPADAFSATDVDVAMASIPGVMMWDGEPSAACIPAGKACWLAGALRRRGCNAREGPPPPPPAIWADEGCHAGSLALDFQLEGALPFLGFKPAANSCLQTTTSSMAGALTRRALKRAQSSRQAATC